MYCRSCGIEVTDPQEFCRKCGTRLFAKPEILSAGDVTGPGRVLHARFLALGNMTGKTADEIIVVVGHPSSMSSIARGKTLLQWQATGCHMALVFDADGRFEEITHQYAQYSPAPTIIHVASIFVGVAVGIVVLGIVMALAAAIFYR
jgi:hypothetical protein